MHRLHSALLTVLLASTAIGSTRALAQTAATSAAPMTNSDVVALVRANLGDDIVIAKIQAAPSTAFDTSVNGLSALQQAHVSAAVIRVMLAPHTATAVAGAPAPPADPDDPNAAHDPGLYTVSPSSGSHHLVKLEIEHPRAAKSSGMFAHVITQGAISAKTQEVIGGSKADLELAQARPVFYAYIPQYNGSFGGTFSVKDLVLTKLEVKGDTRLWTFAAHGWFASSEVGNDEKARQGFTSEQIKPGVYKLTPAADMPAGQYAFKYANNYFDFGIVPQS